MYSTMSIFFIIHTQFEQFQAQIKGQLSPLSELTKFNNQKEIEKVSTS